MAMINCPECGKEISDQATSCPNCGAPVKKPENDLENTKNTFSTPSGKKPKKKWKTVVIVVVVIFFLAAVFGSGSDDEEPAASNDATTQEEPENNVSKEKIETEDNVEEESKEDEPQKEDEKKTEKSKETKKQYMKSCKEYEYKKVLRNPDEYIGKRVKITLKISSVHEEGIMTPTKYYFANSNDEYDMWLGDRYGVFDKREDEEPKLLEDDIIEVYGEIAEPEETKSIIVNSQELFCIDMKYVKLIDE